MEFKNFKQSTLIGIAVLISALINLPRVLQLYDVVEKLGKSFASASLNDVIIRTVFLITFSWLVLQFNANWKFIYANYTKLVRSSITVFFNAVWFIVIVLFIVFVHQKITGKLMTASDKSVLYFVYVIVTVILIFISRILRYQIIRQEDIAEKVLLKQQSLQNELSALKNQINLHFLFH